MAITWKQIDTNGNGYVDGTEAAKAKSKGAKNVWNEMTEADYESGTTREQKINAIINQNLQAKGIANHPSVTQTVMMGYDKELIAACFNQRKIESEERMLRLNREIESKNKNISWLSKVRYFLARKPIPELTDLGKQLRDAIADYQEASRRAN